VRWHGDYLLVLPRIVFHDQYANRPDIDDATGHQPACIDDQRPCFFIHLVFDRLSTQRNLDNDVYVVGWIGADRNSINAHRNASIEKIDTVQHVRILVILFSAIIVALAKSI